MQHTFTVPCPWLLSAPDLITSKNRLVKWFCFLQAVPLLVPIRKIVQWWSFIMEKYKEGLSLLMRIPQGPAAQLCSVQNAYRISYFLSIFFCRVYGPPVLKLALSLLARRSETHLIRWIKKIWKNQRMSETQKQYQSFGWAIFHMLDERKIE